MIIAAVVDDHALVGNAIARLIRDRFAADVTCFVTLSDASSGIPNLRPDLVVLDVNLAGEDGVSLYTRLSPSLPMTKWLACTAFGSAAVVSRVVRSGIPSIILKTCDEDEFCDAIRETLSGRPYVCAAAQTVLRSDGMRIGGIDLEILHLLSSDLTPKEIAAQIGYVSDRTIQRRIEALRCRAGVETNTALVKKATELGLL